MKKEVAVVTDSGANLPQPLIERFDIDVIPLRVQVQGQSYRDGIDILPSELLQRLRDKVSPVFTSQPSPSEWLAFYERVQEKARSIVSVHLTGHHSGTVNAARAVAQELAPYPIEVLDTGTVAMAQGFVTLAAARAAQAGQSMAEVVERARSVIPKVDLITMLDSLEFAVRGGRVAAAARVVDNILSVKPLVRVKDNLISIIGQARTRGKAARRLLNEMAKSAGDRTLHVSVLHAGAQEEAERMAAQIRERFRCVEIYVQEAAPALGVHAGPDAFALAFYAD